MSQILVYVSRDVLNHDLYIHNYGIEQCYPNQHFGPHVRDYFLIHFCLEGKGIYRTGNETYHVEKNQAFLIPPNVSGYYKADARTPWKYCWIGFHGIQSETIFQETSLLDQSPVFSFDPSYEYFQHFLKTIQEDFHHQKTILKMQGILYLLLSSFIDMYPKIKGMSRTHKKEEYIYQVIQFIEKHYAHKILVKDIAEYIGLDRSYLTTLFKQFIGISIQEYIVQYRVQQACQLLQGNTKSIGNVARAVGYEDPLLFSKMFKKYTGVPPTIFRSQDSMIKP